MFSRKRIKITVRWLSMLVVGLWLAACSQTGEMQTVTEDVPLEDIDEATVTLNMGAGQLEVNGCAAGLMSGEFTYNVAEWEPEVEYQTSGTIAELSVTQPELDGIAPTDSENRWSISLNENVPLDLAINLGAGASDIGLQSLNLRSLDMETGAGQVTVNLDGNWQQDVEARILGGVGDLLVRLPDGVGARVNVDQGVGSISSSGLTEDGGVLVNEAFGQSEATLDLDIESGIGEITLEVAD